MVRSELLSQPQNTHLERTADAAAQLSSLCAKLAVADPRPWEDLSTTERDQLGLMFVSLKEFSYGLDRLREVSSFAAPGVAIIRFYMSSLYHYFAAYFLVGGAHKLRNVLEGLGDDDLLQPIDELLDRKIGQLTVREIVKSWRDKALVHQSFNMRNLQKRILSPAGLHSPEAGAELSTIVSALFERTQALYVNVALRYPELVAESPDGSDTGLLTRSPHEYPDWERYNPASGVKQAGRFRSDLLVCENPECPSEGSLVSEQESFYLFAVQPIWRRIFGAGSLYRCPFCEHRQLRPLLEGTW